MMPRYWKFLPSYLAAIVYISLSGLVISGCTGAATPEAQTNSRSATIATQQQNDSASPERSPETSDQFGLEENIPYREARSRLIQQGWQPNVQGDPPDLNDASVRELVDLGYEEVKACSGTGLGPCRFEFTNAKGQLLVVSAITQGASNRERVVWRWFIEEKTSLSRHELQIFL
ncbi:MAG TPA: hypothetical protein V6C63_06670 [Allocoleopsis sp.]